MAENPDDIPAWLLSAQDYTPQRDSDGFIRKSSLSITGVLARFRLDDGAESRFSSSAPVKLVIGLVVILLTSLSRNFFFVLIVLAGLLVRMCFLPAAALKRVVAVALTAAGLCALIMLPAIFIGQSQSAVLIATKVLVSAGTAMTVALSTPANQLTGALRTFHVPDIVIMTVDLALRSIVQLGNTALEVLCALKLRSVGRNTNKRDSMGGVGGVVLLKSSQAASETHDAMKCRGFEGQYVVPRGKWWRKADAFWVALMVVLVVAFVYLQGVM